MDPDLYEHIYSEIAAAVDGQWTSIDKTRCFKSIDALYELDHIFERTLPPTTQHPQGVDTPVLSSSGQELLKRLQRREAAYEASLAQWQRQQEAHEALPPSLLPTAMAEAASGQATPAASSQPPSTTARTSLQPATAVATVKHEDHGDDDTVDAATSLTAEDRAKLPVQWMQAFALEDMVVSVFQLGSFDSPLHNLALNAFLCHAATCPKDWRSLLTVKQQIEVLRHALDYACFLGYLARNKGYYAPVASAPVLPWLQSLEQQGEIILDKAREDVHLVMDVMLTQLEAAWTPALTLTASGTSSSATTTAAAATTAPAAAIATATAPTTQSGPSSAKKGALKAALSSVVDFEAAVTAAAALAAVATATTDALPTLMPAAPSSSKKRPASAVAAHGAFSSQSRGGTTQLTSTDAASSNVAEATAASAETQRSVKRSRVSDAEASPPPTVVTTALSSAANGPGSGHKRDTSVPVFLQLQLHAALPPLSTTTHGAAAELPSTSGKKRRRRPSASGSTDDSDAVTPASRVVEDPADGEAPDTDEQLPETSRRRVLSSSGGGSAVMAIALAKLSPSDAPIEAASVSRRDSVATNASPVSDDSDIGDPSTSEDASTPPARPSTDAQPLDHRLKRERKRNIRLEDL